jgi:hypothetical protein
MSVRGSTFQVRGGAVRRSAKASTWLGAFWLLTGLLGCGAATAGAGSFTTPPDPLPEVESWVFVSAPNWDLTEGPTTQGDDPCGTFGNVRFCQLDGVFVEVAIDAGVRHIAWLGNDGDHHYFHNDAGRVFVAEGFGGLLRSIGSGGLPSDPRVAHHAPGARISLLDVEGRWHIAEGAALRTAALPGRVYDAYFETLELGRALVEPGDIYVTTDGGGSFVLEVRPNDPPLYVPGVDPRGRFMSPLTLGDEWFDDVTLARGVALPDADEVRTRRNAHWGGHGYTFAPGVVSFDGEAALSRDRCVSIIEGAPVAPEGTACFVGGAVESVHLPPGTLDASILALDGEVMIVGGQGCPPALCGDAPLVRVVFDADGRPTASPLSVIGTDWPASMVEPPGDAPPYRNSPFIPEPGNVRMRWRSADADLLLAGPTSGPLRAHRLPAPRGDLAFADAAHGVFVSSERVWTTLDGGESWTPVDSSLDVRDAESGAMPRVRCSRDACRVGGMYWLSVAAAHRLRFPAPVARATPSVREAEEPSSLPFSAPEVRHGEVFARLDGTTEVGDLVRLVDGMVRFDDRSNGSVRISWRSRNAPNGMSLLTSSNVAMSGRVRVWAATGSMFAFSAAPVRQLRNVAPPFAVEVATVGGQHHSHQLVHTPSYMRDVAALALPMADGGLVLAFQAGHATEVLELDRQGRRVRTRAYGVLATHRDEYLAVRDGEPGLVLPSHHGGATFFGLGGSEVRLEQFVSPRQPCTGSEEGGGPAMEAVSRWRSAEDTNPDSGTVVFSAHQDGDACWRAIVPAGDPYPPCLSVVDATQSGVRAQCFTSSGVTPLRLGESVSQASIDEIRMRSAAGIHIEGDTLYAWTGLDHPRDGLHRTTIGSGTSGFTEVALPQGLVEGGWVSSLLPGGLLHTNQSLFRIHAGAVEQPDVGPGGIFHAAMGPEGMVMLRGSGVSLGAHWTTAQGQPASALIPVDAHRGGAGVVGLTESGDAVLQLTASWHDSSGGAGLRRWTLSAGGRLTESAQLELQLPSVGGLIRYTDNRDGTFVALSIPGYSETSFVRARGRRFVAAAPSIPSMQSPSEVVTVATPSTGPVVAWRDIPVDGGNDHLRLARLVDGEWQELVPPRRVPPRQQTAVAVADDGRIFLLEVTGDVSLFSLADGVWRLAARM